MRVTENTNFNTVRETIRRSKERMENLQGQHSTLKKLNTPSDDPIGSAKVLEVRTEKVNNTQFIMNGKLAETFLDNTDHAIGEIADLIARAKEIAVNQSSMASANEETRLGVSEEVTQLYNQAIATANRRIGDRYLFGGFKTTKPPVSGDGAFLGDDGKMNIEISKDVFVAMNLSGIDVFNSNPKDSDDGFRLYGLEHGSEARVRSPVSMGQEAEGDAGNIPNVNVFDELQNLRIGLMTNDTEAIRGTLERFDLIHNKLLSTRAKVGSRIQGVKSAQEAMDRHNLTNANLTSHLEDADMAEVVTNLAKEETVLRSALQSSQKLIQPTLMDFLR